MANDLSVTFWGVRGSIACAGPEYVRYGGNTSCLEVVAGGRRLIFDAGTGIRKLGLGLCAAAARMEEIDIFFTHTHFDHICGLTFFAPLYVEDRKVRLWAGHLLPEHTIVDVVKHVMAAPLHPVSLHVFTADVQFNDFTCGDSLHPAPGVVVRTARLNHPNGATGYRVEHGGRSICYITDTGHDGVAPDASIVGLCRDADVMIYDSTYSDAQYPAYRGWGHSTWQEAIRVGDTANVGTVAIFHHDPAHDDAWMDRVAAEVTAMRPGIAANGLPRVLVAREGTTLRP